MLETPSIRWYSFSVTPSWEGGAMSSENPSGADNQQETVGSMLELDPQWVVGFVDGEGCFSVSLHRNPNVRSTGGWQVHPTFQVYQHMRYRAVLEALISVFGCGRLRSKGPNSSVWTLPSTRYEISRHTSCPSSSATLRSSSVTTSSSSPRSSPRCGGRNTSTPTGSNGSFDLPMR